MTVEEVEGSGRAGDPSVVSLDIPFLEAALVVTGPSSQVCPFYPSRISLLGLSTIYVLLVFVALSLQQT